jgi:hypothetical protein
MRLLEDPASEMLEKARVPLQLLARQWERQNADICKLETQIVRAAKTDEVARRLGVRSARGYRHSGRRAGCAHVQNRARFCRLAWHDTTSA